METSTAKYADKLTQEYVNSWAQAMRDRGYSESEIALTIGKEHIKKNVKPKN